MFAFRWISCEFSAVVGVSIKHFQGLNSSHDINGCNLCSSLLLTAVLVVGRSSLHFLNWLAIQLVSETPTKPDKAQNVKSNQGKSSSTLLLVQRHMKFDFDAKCFIKYFLLFHVIPENV